VALHFQPNAVTGVSPKPKLSFIQSQFKPKPHTARRTPDPADPLVLHFQPDAGDCEYFPYRRREVLAQLLASNADILVAGDSMMRQVFSRLVQMMRGQRRVLDCAFLSPNF